MSEETTKPKPKFGITEETKSKNLVPFKVTKSHPINAGVMTKVAFEDIEKKDTSITHALVFYFEDETKERSHREVEWILDEDDAKFANKLEAFQSRIKHIYEEFAPFPKEGIGTDAENMVDFYKAIEKAFNTNGKEGQPIYKSVPIWIKLTWYKGNLKFPYSPNFIEKMRFGADKVRKETNLVINPKYDVMDNDVATSNAGAPTNIPADTSAFTEEFPSFS